MISLISKPSKLKKVVNVLLAFTFLSYNVSYGSTRDIAPPNIPIENRALAVDDIGIGIDTGTIKSSYTGNTGKTIIHIQDAHCNFEAQSNINKILDQLTKECAINMISVEGAEGIVDTAWFRAFPDAEIRQEVATYFMKKGEITGAEFFSINSDYPGIIYGAETRDYYIKNLKAFTDVYPYKDTIEKYFSDLRVIAQRLKSLIYTPKLKELDLKIRGFDKKDIELSDFAAYLEKVCKREKIDFENYPNFKKLLQTLEYEDKIDFDIVDQERSQYIDLLGKKLPKEEMTELVAQSIKFKKGHIKAVDFYFFLRELAKEKKIDMVNEFPNLFYYYIYTKLYDGINNESLFKEINAIQLQLKDKLFRSDDERQLDKTSEIIDMFVDLVNIELTNEDYDLFKTYSKEYSLEDVVAFISMLSNRYNLSYNIEPLSPEIVDKLPNMVDFYEIAMIRDEALIDNTLKKMDEDGRDRAIFIAGGFHTRGIKKLLEKKGISYVVITPKITKDVETPYIKVLTNQRTTLEDIITDSGPMPTQGKQVANAQGQMLGVYSSFTLASKITSKAGIKEMEQFASKTSGVGDILKNAQEFVPKVMLLYARAYLEEVSASVEERSGEEAWDRFLKDDESWKALRMAILTQYEAHLKNLEEQGHAVTGKEDKIAKLQAAIDAYRHSVGENAIDSGSEKVLSRERYQLYDGLLTQLFSEAEQKGQEVENEKINGVTVFFHDGLDTRISQENVKRVAAGQSLIPGTRVHPGTLKGVRDQIHVDKDWWEGLSAKDQSIVINHETIHLNIYNYRLFKAGQTERDKLFLGENGLAEKTYKLWEAYVKHQKNKKQPIDQEDFVDRIGSWAMDLNVEGVTKEMFPDTNTADIRENLALFRSENIINRAKKAFERDDVDTLGETLASAFILAAGTGKAEALVSIINEFGQERVLMGNVEDPGNINFQNISHKNVFQKFAKNYPFWARRGLVENASVALTENGQKMLDIWYKDSPISGISDKTKREKESKDMIRVIFCGGGGERLFAGSTLSDPKQTTRNLGLDLTLVEMNIKAHIESGAVPEKIILQTIPALKKNITAIAEKNGIPKENVFVEPERGDTSGAAIYPTAVLARMGKADSVIGFFTADHFLNTELPARDSTGADVRAFEYVLSTAAYMAKYTRSFVTLGITPQEPSEEYGCIKSGEPTFAANEGVVMAEKFIEKPKGEHATAIFNEMTKDNKHAWLYNAGIFITRVDVFMDALNEVAPVYGVVAEEMASASEEDAAKAEKQGFQKFAKWKSDGKFPNSIEPTGFTDGVSFDYVLAQPLSRGEAPDIALLMVPYGVDETLIEPDAPKKMHIPWMDIGGFKALYEYNRDVLNNADENGNVVNTINPQNITLGDGVKNNLVIAMDSDVKIRLNNIKDSLVIYNPDIKTVLVAPIDVKGADIKVLLKELVNNKALAGYPQGDLSKIIPADKKVPLITVDGTNVISEFAKGDGKVMKSASSVIDVSTGMAIMISMEGDHSNVVLTMNPQSGTDSPEISVEQLTPAQIEEVQSDFRNPSGMPFLNREERLLNTYKMIERGDITLEELTPEKYLSIYGEEEGLNPVKEVASIERAFNKLDKFKTLKFGTSGLRDKDGNLIPVSTYAAAFGVQDYLMNLKNRINEIPEDIRKLVLEGAIEKGSDVALAGDFRPSTPEILVSQAAAILASGNKVKFLGNVGSPVVALYGFVKKVASIMVTGSHIPKGENGIKYNRPNGEVLKEEEALMLEYINRARLREYFKVPEESLFNDDGKFKELDEFDSTDSKQVELRDLLENAIKSVGAERNKDGKFSLNKEKLADSTIVDKEGEDIYEDHLVKPYGRALVGQKALFWQQTSISRDLLPRAMRKMGADIKTVGRVNEDEEFIPIDTENMKEKYIKQAEEFLIANKNEGYKVLFTTDGDGDRPVVIYLNSEDKAVFIPGDKLNAIAIELLQPDYFAVPGTANNIAFNRRVNGESILKDKGIITAEGKKTDVKYEKVGSPYIVKSLYTFLDQVDAKNAIGCEVNGGFFIGDKYYDIPADIMDELRKLDTREIVSEEDAEKMGKLQYLPTRDAGMPMILLMLLSQLTKMEIPELVEELFSGKYSGFTIAGLVENVDEHVTPGCEKYTPEVGKGIVASLTPVLASGEAVDEVFYGEDGEITYTIKDKKGIYAAEGEDKLQMINIKETMDGQNGNLKEIVGMENAFIEAIQYIDGVRFLLSNIDEGGKKNKEAVHLRPSGNSAQFRVYTAAATPDRARDIMVSATTENTGMLVKMIQDFVGTDSAGDVEEEETGIDSVGMFAVAPGQASKPTAVSRAQAWLEKQDFFKTLSAREKDIYKTQVEALDNIIKSGDAIPINDYFKLGRGLDEYNWGQLKEKSNIFALRNIKENAIVDYLFQNLNWLQKLKLKAEYEKTDKSLSFAAWVKTKKLEDKKAVVAERWFQSGEINMEGVLLPINILSFWPSEIFGDKYTRQHGAENDITGKYLDSGQALSLQMHGFSEIIRGTGTAYIGFNQNVTAEQVFKACEEGTINTLMNEIQLDPNITYLVPPYLSHAYGKNVTVFETKAVSPAEDATGTISFYDRLKFLPSSMIMTAEELVKANPGREKKDVLTMKEGDEQTPGTRAYVRKWLNDAQANGMLDKLDQRAIESIPTVLAEKGNSKFSVMGSVPKRFIAGEYEIAVGETINSPDILTGKYHPLVVKEGKVKLTTSLNKKEFILKKGDEFLVYANMGEYKLEALEGNKNGKAVIYTHVKPVSKKEETIPIKTGGKTIELGEGIDIDVSENKESVVMRDAPFSPLDELDVKVTGKVPDIIYGRAHTIIAAKGQVELRTEKDNELIATLNEGEKKDMAKNYMPYLVINKDVSQSTVTFDYEKTDTEKTAYAAFEMVKKYYAEIIKTLDESKVVIITRAELYAEGGKDDVGSVAWEQNLLDKAFGKDKVEIRPYSLEDHIDFNGAMEDVLVGKRPRENERFVLAATGKDLKSVNAKIADELKKLRIIALPDNVGDKEVIKNGWALATAVESTALLQAALKVETFTTENDYVEDMKSLMERLTDKSLSVQDLYYMLPFSDLGKTSFYKKLSEEAETEEENALLRLFMNNLVARLGLKPIEPFDPRAELQSRLKVMYSA